MNRAALDRRSSILDFIQRSGSASIAELTRAFGVSPVTVHRDLQRLADEDKIERVRGGARSLVGTDATLRSDWTTRLGQARSAKHAIARYANERYVQGGSTIFIDASTTCFALAKEIALSPPRGLTIVTTSPAIAHEIRLNPLHVICAPGDVDQNHCSIGGRWTEEFLAQLAFSTAFVSAAAVNDGGLFSSLRTLRDTLRVVHRSAHQTVALVDSVKFGRSALLQVMAFDEVDALITDDGLDDDLADHVRRAGARLSIAESG